MNYTGFHRTEKDPLWHYALLGDDENIVVLARHQMFQEWDLIRGDVSKSFKRLD